jgi:hypothetical protein
MIPEGLGMKGGAPNQFGQDLKRENIEVRAVNPRRQRKQGYFFAPLVTYRISNGLQRQTEGDIK